MHWVALLYTLEGLSSARKNFPRTAWAEGGEWLDGKGQPAGERLKKGDWEDGCAARMNGSGMV